MFATLRRFFFFGLVNIMIMVMLSISWSIISAYLGLQQDYTGQLIGLSLVFGFGGAFISLFMSKWMAKRMFGLTIIDPQSRDANLRRLVDKVHHLARQAGLKTMPEVGIYDSAEVNAFATGPSKSNSLVAVSTGLLRSMDEAAVEGVLGHEVAHIANGDMVTMTLIQGVVNTFVIFLSRIVANFVANSVDERYRGIVYTLSWLALEILLGLLATMVVAFYSRKREFRADAGGARYAGRTNMIRALQSLQRNVQMVDTEQKAFASLKISSGPMRWFSTHPSLEARIARLERMAV